MNPEQAVLDTIDSLVNDQLEGGEPYRDAHFPTCRCGDYWHGLPSAGCPGSDVEGPIGVAYPDLAVLGTALTEAAYEVGERLAQIWRRLSEEFAAATTTLAPPLPDDEPHELIPRPSTTPPMWAVDPTRSRRTKSIR